MLVNLFGIIHRLMLVAIVAILAGCATVPGMPSGAKEETIFIDHQDQFGRPIKLELLLFLPEGKGPFDVVLYSHGGQPRGDSRRFSKEYDTTVAPPFTKKGIAVAMLIRQGRGNSGGMPASLTCNLQSSQYGFASDYGDVLAGLRYIQASALFAGKKVYAVGHSRGGILSAALAANRPTEIAGAVGFGTGWMSVGRTTSCSNGQELLNSYFELLVASNASPTLFIYDENDEYYPPSSPKEAFARYKARGGKGEMITYPRSRGRQVAWMDGHFMMASTDVWEKDVMRFLSIDK